ncbi:MAG: hypothetical protein PHW04_09460 [Candidatus Wallbacteria bacterium]|nr:hypothetical protein [Candidatus Wallbacteria bacterium]
MNKIAAALIFLSFIFSESSIVLGSDNEKPNPSQSGKWNQTGSWNQNQNPAQTGTWNQNQNPGQTGKWNQNQSPAQTGKWNQTGSWNQNQNPAQTGIWNQTQAQSQIGSLPPDSVGLFQSAQQPYIYQRKAPGRVEDGKWLLPGQSLSLELEPGRKLRFLQIEWNDAGGSACAGIYGDNTLLCTMEVGDNSGFIWNLEIPADFIRVSIKNDAAQLTKFKVIYQD